MYHLFLLLCAVADASYFLIFIYSCSNGDMDLALEQVEDLVASHLVLWTAAEQLAITQAFEKVKL